jgi:hypothetical protein
MYIIGRSKIFFIKKFSLFVLCLILIALRDLVRISFELFVL